MFHFGTETWTRGPDLPKIAVAHTVLDLGDGRVLLQPGYRGDVTLDAYVLEMGSKAWTQIGDLPSGKSRGLFTLRCKR